MLSAVDVASVPDGPRLWQEIVEESPLAWFWHTRALFLYNLFAGDSAEAKDQSFFIYRDGEVVGLVPFIIQNVTLGAFTGREANSHSGMLPWPLTRPHEERLHGVECEDFAFVEVERRARAAGAARIVFLLSPPHSIGQEDARIERAAYAHKYVCSQSKQHSIAIDQGTLANVRERYRRYYDKFSPLFSFEIIDKDSLTEELEETYFRLHIKDAGGRFRSRESYTRQADLIREGLAVYVLARHKESGAAAGMLYLLLYKGAAFDGSVAVDPDLEQYRVGHLLRFRAIEELLARDIATYDSPLRTGAPAFRMLPTPKERSISHFKEGFFRGKSRDLWILEKYLDPALLHAYVMQKESALKTYFGLS